ncbi:dipeptidase [Roseicyclus sp. F158]|uniref:Dipeptidase n=1 Tax=Tropicimonas omnivorans TaxID=3075590 RepID=A0ABU3DIV5_9RHOB|nr:dipeptidase [Roseicyclus sp. F158]MDT0683664.1 dipeptidase [Roseicyclus sp. F158]
MTDDRLKPVLDRIDDEMPAAQERLMEFLRIQSISTDPEYKGDTRRAAEWLAKDIEGLGLDEAGLRDTPGHPMVVGHGGPDGGAHLLFYGHYDVQPVDPLNLWDRDPFDPAIEETENGPVIRGRGASDDKGQLMTFVEACRAWVAVHGALPCRLTFFFEGEEESGSPSLIPFLEANREELQADVALICDTGMAAPGVPSIATQLRGMLKDEFTLHGPKLDLHSGHYGGPALNPLREISKIVASFHDETGRVAVEGFYEGVEEVPAELLAQWEDIGIDESAYLGHAGMSVAHGEAGYSALVQQWARPTLEINGMWGGYTGVGSKTVIPAEAHCKLTCRLVGQQDPAALRRAVRAHVEARLPQDASVEWKGELDGAPAAVFDTTRPEFTGAREALTEEWERDAVFTAMGGSIPVAGYFRQVLGMESMLIGFASEDDRIHSPNEKYDVAAFHRGTRSWARILAALSK